MIIIIDLRCLNRGIHSGVEEYTGRVLEFMLKHDRANQYKIFTNSWRAPKYNFAKWLQYSNVRLYQSGWPNKILNLCFRFLNWPKIDKMVKGGDVLWMPNLNFAAWSSPIQTTLTVHDLSFEYNKKFFSFKINFWHKLVSLRRLCHEVDKIISVSGSTKSELVFRYKIQPDRIRVIHSGFSSPVAESEVNKNRSSKQRNLLLFLGTLEPRKNIAGLIKAFDLAKPKLPLNAKLVIAGRVGWSSEAIHKAYLSARHKNDIIITGFVDKDRKKQLLNSSRIFIYPSFYEGFGFPVLEATSFGLPVITSNASSLPEVAGSFAYLVDTYNIMDMRQAIIDLWYNHSLRRKMVARGKQSIQKFDWAITAKQTLKHITARDY